MFIKQITVFIENRAGRLEQVTQVLKENNINIVSLSLADTSDYGLLRLIVSNPDKAVTVLKESGFSAMITNVIAVKLTQHVGKLGELLSILSSAGVNVEYMYGLTTGDENASIVIKTGDQQKALDAITESSFELLSTEETYAMND
ncbi:MAG: ACT domain-containing protein [Lachnospiraceae bacterium]|nr:ACT domain-containing protein [Lachnospiraceae bacterium]